MAAVGGGRRGRRRLFFRYLLLFEYRLLNQLGVSIWNGAYNVHLAQHCIFVFATEKFAMQKVTHNLPQRNQKKNFFLKGVSESDGSSAQPEYIWRWEKAKQSNTKRKKLKKKKEILPSLSFSVPSIPESGRVVTRNGEFSTTTTTQGKTSLYSFPSIIESQSHTHTLSTYTGYGFYISTYFLFHNHPPLLFLFFLFFSFVRSNK